MDMYNFPEQGHTNAYMIQHTDQYQGMYSEGGPEFVVDNQGVYYPTHTNYGYISRVYESGIDWDEQHRVFGVDTGNVQTVYYTTPPSYGHTQSLYNPYNPYIPGAILGVDNTSFMNGQQYYTVPTYDNNPAYFSNPVNPFIDNSTPTPAFVPASTQSNSFSNTKQPLKQRNVSSTSYPTQNEAKNTVVDKLQPKFFYGKITDDVKSSPQDPRKNQLIVKAYTSRAGDVDEKGNITIDTDEYNRDDFVVDFVNAKFFVIKSYSEDDVHKSIKYNVWSSTPNGNKKLNNAYEDAKRITTGCPIFLFFSVNASGQFCGVAEMNGSVDFHKDMDFWQQDKWSGSFPVKWHIIKDVPNPNFRHIILENNENKPVTNSRDTQEIRQRKGIEVLKIFKGYKPRTSLLDDFMYYENRQKILQEEKAKLLIKNFGSSFVVPVLDPPRKLQSYLNLSSNENEKKQCNDDDVTFKIGSLTINPKPKHSQGASSVAKSSEFLTIGTIPISPRALHHD